MPSESIGGNGSEGTSGASAAARGHGGGVGGWSSSGFGGVGTDQSVASPGFTSQEKDSIDRIEGMNPNNPTQSLGEMKASEFVGNKVLPAVRDILGSVALPGVYNYAKTAAGVASDMNDGMSLADASKRAALGLINSKLSGAINTGINQATGGAYGDLGMVSSLSGLVDGPTMPNIGKAVSSGLINSLGGTAPSPSIGGLTSGPSENGFTINNGGTGGTSATLNPVQTDNIATPPPTPKATETPQTVNANLFGNLNSSGWSSALTKLNNSRKGK